MILCLDVGNTQIFGGIFDQNVLKLKFRFDSSANYTSDQYGVFLKNVLRENNIDAELVSQISFCSVVPHIDYSLRAACIKYFNIEPFSLQVGTKTGLKVKYKTPSEVGSDRISNAIAAINAFPNKNIIVIDFGTATTLCAISKDKEYLGGIILAGMRLSMNALQSNTAKLSPVEIIKPSRTIGKTTAESIQSGLYYGQLATIESLCQRITIENFIQNPPVIIGTGGFAHLFNDEGLFNVLLPDLVLDGLKIALENNSIPIGNHKDYANQ